MHDFMLILQEIDYIFFMACCQPKLYGVEWMYHVLTDLQ